jgi:S1/P1 Nuclease
VNRILLAASAFFISLGSAFPYGPTGHEIVGGIADKLIANTPAAQKIYAFTDGITLERASTIADEIKAWDKNGVDDMNAFPRYSEHPKIDKQLREFWRSNPPTQDSKSAVPSHHWFHYTDVPVLNLAKYSAGRTGRTQWDVVHMIAYCVDVLRGDLSEDNPRKITKSVAVILLAHYAGDIHQPLHVGAEYFNHAGQAVDPDKGQAGVEDEGGNTLVLRLFHGTAEQMEKRGLKLHGFWDNDTVMANLPAVPADLTKEERFKMIEPAKHKLIDQFAKQEPQSWRAPANIALNKYSEFWADDILPIAKEAHDRLQFINVHETVDQEKTVMAGDAREKNMPDRVSYADWSAKIVRDELHKAGLRLADLLTQAVGSTSINSTAAITPPGKTESTAEAPHPIAGAAPPSKSSTSASDFGTYPTNYKEVIVTWLKKYGLDPSRIDWEGEPKPAEMPNASGQRFAGYLVIFNTSDHGQAKTRSVLIRDGVVVNNNGF